MILCLETSTSICSVALCSIEGVISARESIGSKSHASQLTVYIEDILSETGLKVSDLDAVAVSKGPGSYTGLRIGVSVAKGLAYASAIPLISVETALSMYHGISGTLKEKYETDSTSLFVPMVDARRMEVYYSIFTAEGDVYKEIAAEIIGGETFSGIDESVRMLAFGDGAVKCKEVVKRKNFLYADEFTMSASHMYKPAYKAFAQQRFEDIAYFEPFYLKDFITSQPKKSILGR